MENALPRERYPDEDRYPWLVILLDAYAIFERGTRGELARAERTRAGKLACHAGCDACCRRPTVPVSELEVLGLSWYALSRLEGEAREEVREQLKHHREHLECPFLLHGACAAYAVRPFACRILHVFGEPCKPEEIPIESRPQDIWTPSREVVRPAMYELLTYYGFTRPEDKEAAFDNGYIPAASHLLSELTWENLPFDAPQG